MVISRCMVTSDYHNTYHKQSFQVVERLPNLNEVIDDCESKKVYTDCIEYSTSDFTGEDRSYDEGYYRYYRLTYSFWYENDEKEDSNTEYYEYYAVFEKYSDNDT